jgi:4-amino-4-deoxy-L-arabinose transferase-like glycosyltransferase
MATILRFYKIGSYPSLNPDEAALGYNAYSLLETGKDEHGASWPLHFKSFGDYKPGGYVYLALPFIKILGLTPLAVRLPNLILSILAIYYLSKLVFLLFESKGPRLNRSKAQNLSLLSSAVLALSPWHIHFSRGAWEAYSALSLIIIGIYFFYSHLKNLKNFHLYLSVILISLSLYFYHSARILAPLIGLSLVTINFKRLTRSGIRKLLIPIIITILLALPVLFSFVRNGGAARFGGVGLTADQGPIWRSNELLNQHNNVKLINRAMHNKRILYFLSWAQKYTSHFDLNFLFLNGDEVPRSKVPEMGQLYLFELPFLIIGIFFFLKSRAINKKTKTLILSFLLFAPLASSLTFQAPSALRSLPMTIPLSILIAYGLYHFFKCRPLLILIAFCSLLSIFYYLDAYFVHSQKRYPYAWNLGFDQIVSLVESQKNNYQNIFFTSRYDQPYILYLFFSKYPPQKLQSQIKLTPKDQYGFSTVDRIDNITFIIPTEIPSSSMVIEASDFQLTGQSFKIYTK